MKRIVVMAVLALALPVAAFAGNVGISNQGGTLSGNASGLTLSGSTLIAVGSVVGSNLGSLSFTTGALTGGTLSLGGTFAAGGTFVITTNGTDGLPSGTLFSGTFSSPVTWSALGTGSNGSIYYSLTGNIKGTWYNGRTVSGATIQLTFNAGKNGFMGSVPLEGGWTGITTVPEPGTLGLLGTGLVGLAGLLRKKFKA